MFINIKINKITPQNNNNFEIAGKIVCNMIGLIDFGELRSLYKGHPIFNYLKNGKK